VCVIVPDGSEGGDIFCMILCYNRVQVLVYNIMYRFILFLFILRSVAMMALILLLLYYHISLFWFLGKVLFGRTGAILLSRYDTRVEFRISRGFVISLDCSRVCYG